MGTGGAGTTAGGNDAGAALDATSEIDNDGGVDASEPLWAQGCDLPSSTVLWTTIQGSALSTADRQLLCRCFGALEPADSNALIISLFNTGTPEFIAQALESLVGCCTRSPERLSPRVEDGTFACGPVIIYKGVALPP
jgi:hypothetical protein